MAETDLARRTLARGLKYPYDAPSGWWRGEGSVPPSPRDWAHAAARGVIADLTDRHTIKRGFEGIDDDIRKEIVGSLAAIIRAAAEGQVSASPHNGDGNSK